MTEPSDIQPALQAEAAADLVPEVRPEVISDLDVPSEDAKHIAGASLVHCGTN